jgi:glycosyltransferase involved in cell wall biosynthesis
MTSQKGLLLVLPVPLRLRGDRILVESQAFNGLERWADNFGSVVIAAPIIPEDLADQDKTTVWKDTANLTASERFEIVPLPWAYTLPKFIACYLSVRKTLAALIARCRYLQFAIGGLWGDWAAVAAMEARKQKRAYAVHTDRVEHQVILQVAKEENLPKKIKATVLSPLMAKYHQWIISHCSLGLWHGDDCYAAYSPFCSNSHLIHDIHLKSSDRISETELTEKCDRLFNEETLRICYAGRMEAMKAPLDWVRAIGVARDLGVDLEATWMGDGSLFEQVKELVKELNLEDYIRLSGFESARDKLLQIMKKSHLMLFTHITPESPRCLIESFICGTPIVGYQSNYAQDLVKDKGGGVFVPVEHWQELGQAIASLWQNRQNLGQLIQVAGKNGKRFSDEAVFLERSELIKRL